MISKRLYLLVIWILHLFNLIKCIEGENSPISEFVKIPDLKKYPLGNSITFSCTVYLIPYKTVVVFRKDKTLKSEDCIPFDVKRHSMECNDVTFGDRKAKVLKLTIKEISWEDRGQWDCLYVQSTMNTSLDITVNPTFDKLQVQATAPVMAAAQNFKLTGRGSRTNPYDLREGASVDLTCLSSCSFPETMHNWFYKNSSHSAIDIKVVKQKRREICNIESNKGMIASESEVTINCSSHKIVGANMVVCSGTGEGDKNNASVYIICPGGERPWEMTTGEIVGVALSVGISISLVFFICMMIKRSMYSSVPGGISTGTYSSGIKV